MAERNWIEKRTELKTVLPLDVPINIKIEPSHSCNFKCIYCFHSNTTEDRLAPMSLDTFQKFINGWTFNKKAKSITFAGDGEPLLNKHTPQFISMAREIAEETILVTNGSLLTNKIADKLIEAKLDTVRVSLQGLNTTDYKNNCSFNINFQKFLDNLEYFYKNKGDMNIWLKMPDIALKTEERKTLFKELFEDKCDYLTEMSIQPFYEKLDYSKIQIDSSRTIFLKENQKDVLICPNPFYMLYLYSDGSIYLCVSLIKDDLIMGNIHSDSVFNIWNGKKFKDFRYRHLRETYKNMPECRSCLLPILLDNHYDNIDSERDRLLGICSFTHSTTLSTSSSVKS